MDNYKEIKIKTPNMEDHIEVDLDTKQRSRVSMPIEKEQKSIEVTIESAPTSDEDDDDGFTQIEEPVVQKVQQPQQRKPSRANKRIRELNARAQELEATLEQERKDKQALMKQLTEGNKSSRQTLKSSLQSQMASLNSQMRQAMQDGNTDQVVSIQDALMDAKMQMKVIELEEAQPEPVVEAPQAVRRAPPPEAAVQWVEDHPEMNRDQNFAKSAMSVNNSLLNEGYDPESDEFYEELSLRLERRFPQYFPNPQEQFVLPDENSVEYSQGTQSPSIKDVKQPPRQQPQQTVSGASRTSNAIPNRRPVENKVTLTPQDLDQMDRWGMSLERMAKRKLHIEKNKRDDGYVSIMIPTDNSNR